MSSRGRSRVRAPRADPASAAAAVVAARRPRAPKRPSVRTSNFLVTLNTNRPVISAAQYAAVHNDIQDRTTDLWENEAEYSKVIRFLEQPRNMDDILDIDVESHPEIGPKGGLIHGHVIIKIVHRTRGRGIQLNIPALKAYYKEHAVTPELRQLPYLNVFGFSDYSDVLKYIKKSIHAKNEAMLHTLESSDLVAK